MKLSKTLTIGWGKELEKEEIPMVGKTRAKLSKERLQRLLSGDHFTRYEGGRLSLSDINVLPQPRQTFEEEELKYLAEDIAQKNLLNPLIIAEFDHQACLNYLAVINEIWGTNFTISDLKSKTLRGKKFWYILIAGERRLRACRKIYQEGCFECLEKFGQEKPGKCFHRHFPDGRIEVRICRNIPPRAALSKQFSENTHIRPPAHEEAKAYNQYYRLLKVALDEKFPISAFAREVGRSPESIRNALRFCNLPVFIQEAVEGGRIVYGIAVEMARLKDDGATFEELDWWLTRTIVCGTKVPEFHDQITKHLADKHAGQRSLMDIFQAGQIEESRRSHFKKVVEANSIQGLWAQLAYFRRVIRLYDEGKLGAKESPFSAKSPAKLFCEVAECLDKLWPCLVSHIPQKDRLKVERQIRRAGGLNIILRDYFQDERP